MNPQQGIEEMTTTLEYTTRDKSTWGAGEWQNEPDKVQWVDEATGLDCLIVRGPSGALCGYVGVGESHPYFGIEYSGCTRTPRCEEVWCGHAPESAIEVHGGLTFSDSCNDATPEKFRAFQGRIAEWEREAQKHPSGDAARLLRERGKFRDDYEGWAQHMEASSICHRPMDGRPDRVWWFGFDCAHSGDLCPAYNATDFPRFTDNEWYKPRHYVENEVRRLAEQLARVTPGTAPFSHSLSVGSLEETPENK
jgi:hypothetical protein